MAVQTIEDVEAGFPVRILAAAMGALRGNLAALLLVSRDLASEDPATKGDTVKAVKRGSVTVRDKGAGAIVADAPENTMVALTLDRHKYVAWESGSVVTELSLPQTIQYVVDGMTGLAEAIEADVLSTAYTDAGQFVGTAATALDDETILDLMEDCDNRKWPGMGRVLVVGSKEKASLLRLNKMIDQSIRGDLATQALTNAQLGTLYGFQLFWSSGIASTSVTAGSPAVTTVTRHNVAMMAPGVLFASRPLTLPENVHNSAVLVDEETGIALRYVVSWNHDNLSYKHSVDVLYGVAVVDERLVTEVRA
jgi:hypothetical protein